MVDRVLYFKAIDQKKAHFTKKIPSRKHIKGLEDSLKDKTGLRVLISL